MQLIKELTRDEMKNIMAGDGSCLIAWRDADDNFLDYGQTCVTYDEAISYYNPGGEPYTEENGDYVSGYCCDSCGEAPFENAPSYYPCLN